MIRGILIAVAIVAVFFALAVRFDAPTSMIQDSKQLVAIQSMHDAIDRARHLAKHDLYGAQVVVTNGPNAWSGNLNELQSSGTAGGTEAQYGGDGTVVLSGASASDTLTVAADPQGNITATQGSVQGTCPFTFTVDGGTLNYVC